MTTFRLYLSLTLMITASMAYADDTVLDHKEKKDTPRNIIDAAKASKEKANSNINKNQKALEEFNKQFSGSQKKE